MNRRNIIRNAIKGAFAVAVVPGAALAAKSHEDVKREIMRGLLAVSNDESHEISLLRIAMTEDHYCRPYALELFESGVPVSEVYQKVTAKIHYNLYGPKGAPVWDKEGRNQIGGGYYGYWDDHEDDERGDA